MGEIGIFIQQSFPFGAFGPRQWSLDEMGRLFRWLRTMGYDAASFMLLPILRQESCERTILEQGGMYHAGLIAPPPFEPGFLHCPADRYLGTPEGLARAAFCREQFRLCRESGLKVWQMVTMTLGAPGYLEDHPELAAVVGSETFCEGTAYCPSRPKGLEHLLEFHRTQIEYLEPDGVILFPRDPGGCGCSLCQPQGEAIARTSRAFCQMIRSAWPDMPLVFLSWHIKDHEAPQIAAELPKDVRVFESPRIHALDVPAEEYDRRVRTWREHGRRVGGWLETQENPTALLPTVYPRRVAATIERMKELGVQDLWQTSMQNPYLFPLNFWMTPKLWTGATLDALVREFLERSFGSDALDAGLAWVEATERAWDKVQTLTQYGAGFLGLFVVTYPERLLPEKMIRDGVPETVRTEVVEAMEAAARANEAAQQLADQIRTFHALEANAIAVSAEVFMHRVAMRRAKLDVLDALHAGDADRAITAWPAVRDACQRMVAAARSVPNTEVLVHHWRRLGLLPDRLRTLEQHLRELAERKTFRPVHQPLFMGELYKDKR